ncbi:MAG: hypothetical protein AAFR38_06975 [Planctomycetota bacterium]
MPALDVLYGELMTSLCEGGACVGSTMLIFGPNGRLERAGGGWLAAGIPFEELIGRKPTEYMVDPAGEERELLHRQLKSGASDRVLAIDMVNGTEIWKLAVRSGPVGDPGTGVIVFSLHPPASTPMPGGWEIYRYKRVSSAGALHLLTRGELEVLRMLAMGLRRDAIAGALERTVKAVERRRTLLGKKLGEETTVGLAQIATGAGLHRMDSAALGVFAAANCDRGGRASWLVESDRARAARERFTRAARSQCGSEASAVGC